MNLSRKFLAGAIVALLPMTGAFACNTAAWLGTPGANIPIADDPDTTASNPPELAAVQRYSGKCGLQAVPAGNSFVTDNSPSGDGGGATPYRARFYAYTGTTGVAKIFSATDGPNGGGAELISVTYNPGTSNFVIAGPGGAAVGVAGIQANKWYSVELKYQTGTTLDAFVRGGGVAAETTVSTAVVNGGGVDSVRLGAIGPVAGAGNVQVDEFDSSRGATRIGSLLRGDAAGENGGAPDGTCNANDVSAMISEFFLIANQPGSFTLAPGQPDCTEDGAVNAEDISCLITKFFAQQSQGGQPCGGA